MMDNSGARVSIGLPVYNGAAYLAGALDSILSQTYTDFELIISDNASHDSTAEISRAYAAKDPRIRYYRNEINLGCGWNQNRTIELSRGDYYMMAHHDDLRSPEYIERTVRVLDEDPAIVLCYSKTRDIDEEGRFLPREEISLNIGSSQPYERFCDLIRMDHLCEPIFGLMRSSVLKRTSLFGKYADSDRVLLAELSLHGPFHRIPEHLFFRRAHSCQSTAAHPTRQQRTVFFDPKKARQITFPYFREFVEYLYAISRVPLPRQVRMHCYMAMIKWVKVNMRRLGDDLIFALRETIRPFWKVLTSRG